MRAIEINQFFSSKRPVNHRKTSFYFPFFQGRDGAAEALGTGFESGGGQKLNGQNGP
jgi:hypothetical protein